MTATRFSEAIRPWHSSSFVFDGGVVDVKMKGLAGQYRLKNGGGVMSDTPSNTDSYNYVHNAFDADGTAIKRLTGPYEIAPRLALPSGMHFENAKLRSNGERDQPAGARGQPEHAAAQRGAPPVRAGRLAARHPVRRGRVVPRADDLPGHRSARSSSSPSGSR